VEEILQPGLNGRRSFLSFRQRNAAANKSMNPNALFRLFIDRANELENTRFFASLPNATWGITLGLPDGAKKSEATVVYPKGQSTGFPSSVMIKFEMPTQDKTELAQMVQTQLPDKDDFMSFLVTFRKFVAQKELLHLGRIYKEIDRYLQDGFTKTASRQSLRRWRSALKENYPTTVYVHGRDLEPEAAAVRLWMQGHVFHEDPKKKEELGLDRMEQPLRDMVILQFVQFALNVTREILFVRDLLKRVCRLDLLK
jgi:hypothetical protein